MDKDDPLYKHKFNLLRGEYPEKKEFSLNSDHMDSQNQSLLCYLRFKFIQEEKHLKRLQQLFYKSRKGYYETYDVLKTPPISWGIEKKVAVEFERLLKEQLARYPTTIEEDRLLLEQHLTKNHRNCVLLRLGEKEVIMNNLKFAEAYIAFTQHEGDAPFSIYSSLWNRIKNYIKKAQIQDSEVENSESSEIVQQMSAAENSQDQVSESILDNQIMGDRKSVV